MTNSEAQKPTQLTNESILAQTTAILANYRKEINPKDFHAIITNLALLSNRASTNTNSSGNWGCTIIAVTLIIATVAIIFGVSVI